MNPTYTEAVNMKTGTPNFFPIDDVLAVLDLHDQLKNLGMGQVDNIRSISVSGVGHAGTYRLEGGSLNQRPGFYVFLDGKPVLNEWQEVKGASALSAEDLMHLVIEMKTLNTGLKPWEQVSRPMAEVRGAEGVVRLYNSGVIVLSTEYGAHLADELSSTGNTDQLEPLMKLILGLVSGPEDIHVKFYKL